MSHLTVVIPVKAFERAKMRLAPAIDPEGRQLLARRLAAGVIAAADGYSCWVVCDDELVRTFAIEHGAGVIWAPGTDLNGAVTTAVERMAEMGARTAVIVHADLPYPSGLSGVIGVAAASQDSVVIVPDHEGRGTNILAVPTGVGFGFVYGPDSARLHRAEAERLGLTVTVLSDPKLGLDLDRPCDLTTAHLGHPTSTLPD